MDAFSLVLHGAGTRSARLDGRSPVGAARVATLAVSVARREDGALVLLHQRADMGLSALVKLLEEAS